MEIKSHFILYTATDGKVKLEVFLENETLWLTQKMMAELFEVEVNTINYHLKELFKSGELEENSVIRKIRITAFFSLLWGSPPGRMRQKEEYLLLM